MNAKRPPLRQIIIIMTKLNDKGRILKVAREKQIATYKGASIRLALDYSKETLQARREWCEILKEGPTKARTYNEGYRTQKVYHLKLKGN